MKKQDLLKKLASRKFWAMLSALAVSIMVLANVGEGTMTQVVTLIGTFSSIIVYILGQSYVDGKSTDKEE